MKRITITVSDKTATETEEPVQLLNDHHELLGWLGSCQSGSDAFFAGL